MMIPTLVNTAMNPDLDDHPKGKIDALMIFQVTKTVGRKIVHDVDLGAVETLTIDKIVALADRLDVEMALGVQVGIEMVLAISISVNKISQSLNHLKKTFTKNIQM